ncbi:membralin [Caerostris darwini]|uniref:Membralin n=1 Tax=Caerostris darwini TaxID=1538125 RepID=A0AAV4ML77_9ARAC|nr:membralin [Caerostris darwini]
MKTIKCSPAHWENEKNRVCAQIRQFVELMHIFEMQSFHVPAAPLITIVLALVGMEALMSEFFNDSVTAFYVIIVVWIADQFDSVCCRSNASKKHWLK